MNNYYKFLIVLLSVTFFSHHIQASGSSNYGKFVVDGKEPDILQTFAKIQMDYADYQEGKIKRAFSSGTYRYYLLFKSRRLYVY